MGQLKTEEFVVNVLAVDDVVENLTALQMLLEEPGIRLITASGGTEALEILLKEDVALALLDVNMPGMDGFELAELMRGSERTRDVPIIFLTAGSADRSRVFQGYEAGAVDFLVKPLDTRLLISKVGVFAQLHRQKRQLAAQLQEIQEGQRLSDLFVAVLGHDLRNPLASIVNAANLLELKANGDESVKKKAGMILRSSSRMDRLIQQVLDFARARVKGGMPISKANADMAAMLKQAVAEVEPAVAPRVTVEVAGDTKGWWDADRIMQVVSNLVANAANHGDPAEPIRITFDGTQSDFVELKTQNGGVIPPAELQHLFSPFKPQRDPSQRKGLGLGLYIADQLARAHGGELSVQSREGQGTTFMLRLPRGLSAAR